MKLSEFKRIPGYKLAVGDVVPCSSQYDERANGRWGDFDSYPLSFATSDAAALARNTEMLVEQETEMIRECLDRKTFPGHPGEVYWLDAPDAEGG